jgi:hypothetical protein
MFGRCQLMMITDKFYSVAKQIAKVTIHKLWEEVQLLLHFFKNLFKKE